MPQERIHLCFSEESVSAASRLMKAAAERKNDRMGDMTVEEQRESRRKLYEAIPLPRGLEALPVQMAGVPCEWVLRPESYSEKVIFYIHGGGWNTGDLTTSRYGAVLFAELIPYKVLTVQYRLAPEFPFPTGLMDCRAAWGGLLEQGYRPENIALLGDSAGGNLCLALLHLLLGEGAALPRAVGLISPVTDITEKSEIRRRPPSLAYGGWQGERRTIFELYAGEEENLENPLISPYWGELGDFPPLLIHVGGDEPLAADCAALTKKAVAQGADALCKVWREMFHDFTLAGPALRESRLSLAELADFFETYLGQGLAPPPMQI